MFQIFFTFFCPHIPILNEEKPYHTSQYQNALVNSKFTLRSYIHFIFLYEIYIWSFFFSLLRLYILCINIFPISILHYSNWTGKHKKNVTKQNLVKQNAQKVKKFFFLFVEVTLRKKMYWWKVFSFDFYWILFII